MLIIKIHGSGLDGAHKEKERIVKLFEGKSYARIIDIISTHGSSHGNIKYFHVSGNCTQEECGEIGTILHKEFPSTHILIDPPLIFIEGKLEKK